MATVGTVTVRVLVVDDDALVRAGLTLMLDGAHGIRVVAQVADGSGVPAVLDRHPVDVVLMDLRMPGTDGIAATRVVRRRPDPPVVVVLTTFDTADEVEAAMHAGAAGYLLKDAEPQRIVEAVLAAAAGEPVLSPRVARRLMDSTARAGGSRAAARASLDLLTDRERDVVAAIGRGASNADICRELYLTLATVKGHVSSILLKLGLENRTQVALLARDAELP
jgi:DNA-binding NarL/FixJ family response regulator